MAKQLIISIGTGRSGSLSLSHFLNNQNKVRVLHEGKIEERNIRKLIKWEKDEDTLFEWLNYLTKYNNKNKFYGDTGMYYLPYVKQIINKYPNVKFIGLVREKESVINSYISKTEGRNHWYNHKGIGWKKDILWDPCYPKYLEKNKRKALDLYWEEYNTKTLKLQKEYPSNVKIWKIEEFNTIEGKNQILDFIGYNLNRYVSNNFKFNQLRKKTLFQKIKKIWS